MPTVADPLPLTGHPDVDAQARALWARCARLSGALPLDEAVEDFKAQVRALFDAEDARLAEADAAWRDDHLAEREEFEAFADEVLSAVHFDGAELRRFAEAWCVGHLHSAVARWGARQSGLGSAAAPGGAPARTF